MKKTMVVTLVNGQIIQKDLADFIREAQTNTAIPVKDRLPVNAPADHNVFQGLVQFTLINGIESPGTRSKDYFSFIAPSQIKTVEIIFSQS